MFDIINLKYVLVPEDFREGDRNVVRKISIFVKFYILEKCNFKNLFFNVLMQKNMTTFIFFVSRAY